MVFDSEKKPEYMHSGSSTNTNDDAKAFQERISEIIRDVGSPPKLGRLCGLSGQVIRKYAAGESDPSRVRLIAIAAAANVCLQWLATGTGPKCVDERPKEEMQSGVAGEQEKPDWSDFLDPEIVLREAAFIIDAYESFKDQLTPETAADALVERVRRRMRDLHETQMEDDSEKDRLIA